ncbi:PUA domain-containing protein [Chloropicon primus]|uniref:PUA domain-containing protein n=1 Tax=Chloropicon primus TaxID=1764295 RepID=A0A5B8MG76_9CHLO|nr:PUA domain-containing protein [Chloropicon primus]UPQ97561.1 PUA domain-containing protein [Chloropicon primus]|mmetsp:Transcript_5221/g.15692  ORF Transcript_5221/g.15692 Transcript_5221/m.15692 type:complete len:185 (+) Transcript_5221:336-890(+)|eukprot:QDZ18350.1 PUA domain-containing protein [Chloropicon primus]
MFRKFSKQESVSSFAQVKTSVQRGIRAKIVEQYPMLEEGGTIDVLIPKKENVVIAKCEGKVEIVCVNNVPLFYKTRDTPYFPTLRLLHQYPQMMPKLRVDTGAIKFVLSGANIMCPGLTSPGATIHDEVDKETPVAIYAENKECALAIGFTTMSTEEIRTVNQGVGVENIHCLNDGLWKNNVLD